MRKFYPVITLIMAVLSVTLFTPANSATITPVKRNGQDVYVIKNNQSMTFTGNYVGHTSEAWIENAGIISIDNAVFSGNKLNDKLNSFGKYYSTIHNFNGSTSAGASGGTIQSIQNSQFIGNLAKYGGAISNTLGTIGQITGVVEKDENAYTSTVTFKENQADYGGAIWNNQSSRLDAVSGVLFEKNTANANGGAIYNAGTFNLIYNTVFVNNAAGASDSSTGAGYGGAIYSTKDLTIKNSTFIGNSSKTNGSAIAQMNGDLTITAEGKDISGNYNNALFMGNKIGLRDSLSSKRNDIYMGGRGQNIYLYAQSKGNQVVLDGGINLANKTNIYINKTIAASSVSTSGGGGVYINGDVGSSSARANLYIYGGTFSLSNKGTDAYSDTVSWNEIGNTVWADKVTIYNNTVLGFDVYLDYVSGSNNKGYDYSLSDKLVLNSISGTGRFILTEDSFNVIAGNTSSDNFNSTLTLIDTKANISSFITMQDEDGKDTNILYMYDDDNNPLYKIRLTPEGKVIFSNPYYIDKNINPLAYAVNYPKINRQYANSDGIGIVYDLTLKKNISINSWEDLPDENRVLQTRNKLIGDVLNIYGKNKTIKAEDHLIGMEINKNKNDESRYLYAENTTFIGFQNAVTNDGGKVDLYNVSFNNNGYVDVDGIIQTERGGALVNLVGEMSVQGSTKKSKSNFYRNTAQNGGAVYNEGNLKIDRATFGRIATKKTTYANNATYGGALYNYQNNESSLNITNSNFIANTAKKGGAIYNSYDKGTPLTDTIKVYNGYVYDISDATKGDMYYDGAELDAGQIVVDGYIYTNATNKGAYRTPVGQAEAAIIEKATFTHNKASDKGGAIYNEGHLDVRSSTFGSSKKRTAYANTATVAGAAVANCNEGIFTSTASNYYYSSGNYGGAVFNTDSATANIVGGTFNYNNATYGGAIFNDLNATLTLDAYSYYVMSRGNLTIRYTYLTMSRNTAVYGGAIYNTGTIKFNTTNDMSGTYSSNKATYANQNITVQNMGYRNPEDNIKVLQILSGDYDVTPENISTSIDGKQIYDYVTPKGGAIYNAGTTLKTGEVEYNGKIYDISNLTEGAVYESPSELKTTDILQDGKIFDMANSVKGELYIPETILKDGQILNKVDNVWYVFDGATYVSDYVVGSELLDGMIINPKDNHIYTGASYVKDYQYETVLNENQIVYNGSVYEGWVDKGTYIPQTVLKDNQMVYTDANGEKFVYEGMQFVDDYVEGTPLEDGQIVVNGKIYNGADKGAKVVVGTPLQIGTDKRDIVVDGYIYKDAVVVTKEPYYTDLKDNQIVHDDKIYTVGATLGRYEELKTEMDKNPTWVEYNGFVYDINGIDSDGEYVAKTPLGANEVAYEGYIYNIEGLVKGDKYVDPVRADASKNQVEYGGYIYDITDATNTNITYIKPVTPTGDEIVIDGKIYNMANASKVGPYFDGTPLGENQHNINGTIYDFTNAEVVGEYKEETVLGENEIKYNDKVYDMSNATQRDEYVEGTKLKENEIVYDGKVYNIENAVKGEKYEDGTVLENGEIVYNGYVYSNVVDKGEYKEGTKLEEGDIVYNGHVYSGAVKKGDYISAKLNINQANFTGNSASSKVYVIDDNRYPSNYGLYYNQHITLYVGKGGAIYNSSELPLNIMSSTFSKNTAARAGGAICNENKNADINIRNSVFKSNTAKSTITTVTTTIIQNGDKTKTKKTTTKENVGNGGAIYTAGNVNINTRVSEYLKATTFTSNSAAYGGAIYAMGVVDIKGATFTSNSALKDGGAIYSTSDKEFDYNAHDKISEFDFSSLQPNDYGYFYEYGADMDFDVIIKGSTNYVNETTNETITGMPVTFNKNTAKGDGGAILGNKIYVEGATFTSNKSSGNGGAICANSDIVVNPFAFTRDDNGSVPNSVFTSNSAVNGGAIYAGGTSLIKNANFTSNKASNRGGAVYAGDDTLIVGSNFSKNSAAYGGALYLAEGKTAYIINSSFTGNKASKQGGAIYADKNSKMYIMAYANGKDVNVNISGNKAGNKTNSIYMNEGSSLYIHAINYAGGKANVYIDHIDGGHNENTRVYIRTNAGGKVNLKTAVNLTWHDDNEDDGKHEQGSAELKGDLALVAENLVQSCSFYLSGTRVRIDNNSIGTLCLKTLSLADNTTSYAAIDMDLKSRTSDKIQAEHVLGTGKMNVNHINIISNSKVPTDIDVGKDSVISSVTTNKAESAEATYKLKSYYDENGMLRVLAYGQKAKPAAVAAPVAAQIGGYLAQINSYDQAFMNMDMNMLVPQSERDRE
ncbi:TPA: hypothetical protein CPT80_03370, partial [Candidatus Gastranaerophilales bacterium HUM_9]